MKTGFWNVAWVALSLVALLAVPAKAEPGEIRLVTQSFAPLQWDNHGKPDGYVTAYLLAAAERVREIVPVTVTGFDFLPWKRAMLTAETSPNVLFFSLSRTPEREDRFHWLGEVSPYGQYFYQLASRPKIDVERIEELRDLDVRIGVQDGSNLLAYLKKLGFEGSGTLVPITDFHQGIEMLYLGRVDMLPLTGFLAEASACKQGYDGSQLRPVIFVEALAKPLWAVFSKGTDPDLVEAFRAEMAALKDEGFLSAQIREHQANWETLACGALTAGH
ncbi:substrate-binding periplasmic protein [Roseibium sp. Sym1]|uniref:substrate-binding periplasmic protein n=1 Tax=Roseibium sp. Sym1 TaxID=3016006 RepID=UPI0022B31727|nr:ABC transporter substrate-binding protein [Roseibium sp. Sym1]